MEYTIPDLNTIGALSLANEISKINFEAIDEMTLIANMGWRASFIDERGVNEAPNSSLLILSVSFRDGERVAAVIVFVVRVTLYPMVTHGVYRSEIEQPFPQVGI